MAGVDDVIGQWIKRAEKSGELTRGRYWGRPFDLDDAYARTPEELRMAQKILKNAGYVPAEVEMMSRLGALRAELATAVSDADRQTLRQQIAELDQQLSVRLERRRG
jgi:hypothetical protein